MAPKGNNIKRYSIEVRPLVAAQLKAEIQKWLNDTAASLHDIVPSGIDSKDLFVEDQTLNNEFRRIFKDNKVDRLEAPHLYDLIKGLAGSDQMLDLEETKGTYNALEDYMTGYVESRTTGADCDICTLAEKTGAEGDELLRQLISRFSSPADAIKLLVQQDEDQFSELIRILDQVDQDLSGMIDQVDKWSNHLLERETSFLNFMSAENMLGLSAYITFDGRTFSSSEFYGVLQFARNLYKIRAGLRIFRDNLKFGNFVEGLDSVQAFFKSPYGRAAGLDYLSGSVPLYLIADGQKNNAARDFGVGMTDLAASSGALRFASAMADQYIESFGEDYRYSEVLPNPVFRYLDGTFTMYANAFVSWDTLLLFAGGGLLGKGLAKWTRAVTILEKLRKALGRLTKFAPGVPAMAPPVGKSFFRSAMVFTANFGAEIAKMEAYSFVGYAIADEEGYEVGAKVYLFGLGLVSGYSTELGSQITKGLVEGDQEFLAPFFERGTDVEGLIAYSRRAPVFRSFRLPKGTSPKQIANLLDAAKRDFERTMTQTEQVGSLLGDVEAYIKRHAKVVGEEALEKARNAAKLENPQEALRELRELQSNLQRKIGAKRRAVTSNHTSTNGKGNRANRSGGRKRIGSRQKAACSSPNGESVLARLGRYAESPPKKISAQKISEATNGKVVIDDLVMEKLQGLYSSNPALRSRFWNSLKGLIQKKRGWKRITKTPKFADPSRALYESKMMQPYKTYVQPLKASTLKIIAIRI